MKMKNNVAKNGNARVKSVGTTISIFTYYHTGSKDSC